jgi:hypothetical protein
LTCLSELAPLPHRWKRWYDLEVIVPVLQLLLLLAGNPTGVAPAVVSTQRACDDAVQLFEDFEDEAAALKLRTLLLRLPPGEIAAKAHLYLGLIAFNDMKPDLAKAEFRRALEANPAIDLPRQASPKTRLAFAAARRALEVELEARPRALQKAAGPVVPRPAAATTAVPVLVIEPEPTSPSHTIAYVLSATTLVLAGLAIYGGVQVLDYKSMVGIPPQYTLDQIQAAHGSASFWAVGWPVATGLGAAGLVGAVLTW